MCIYIYIYLFVGGYCIVYILSEPNYRQFYVCVYSRLPRLEL